MENKANDLELRCPHCKNEQYEFVDEEFDNEWITLTYSCNICNRHFLAVYQISHIIPVEDDINEPDDEVHLEVPEKFVDPDGTMWYKKPE